jgi:predicted Fe-Mo cluster-binding NifX family protein
MYILIPVDGVDEKHSKITTLMNLNYWALIEFDEGETKLVTFHKDRTQMGVDWVDFIVLENKFENYMEFMEEGMMVLVRREEESIEDIIEAFKFKELDEAGL